MTMHCYTCGAPAENWVKWQNARGMHRWFCDNECLTQWISRSLEQVMNEPQEDLAEVAATENAGRTLQ